MKAKKKSKPFISASLPPEELEEILQRIDENLSTDPVIPRGPDMGSRFPDEPYAMRLPPEPPDYPALVAEIRSAHAPYYVRSGSLPAKLLKSLHNAVLKVFGRKQAYFNELTLDLLHTIGTDLQDRQAYIRAQALLVNLLAGEVSSQREKIALLESRLEQPAKKADLRQKAAEKKSRLRTNR